MTNLNSDRGIWIGSAFDVFENMDMEHPAEAFALGMLEAGASLDQVRAVAERFGVATPDREEYRRVLIETADDMHSNAVDDGALEDEDEEAWT